MANVDQLWQHVKKDGKMLKQYGKNMFYIKIRWQNVEE